MLIELLIALLLALSILELGSESVVLFHRHRAQLLEGLEERSRSRQLVQTARLMLARAPGNDRLRLRAFEHDLQCPAAAQGITRCLLRGPKGRTPFDAFRR